MRVFSGGPGFGLIVVARHAGSLTRKRDLMLANQIERAGTVVPVLPKRLWNGKSADADEDGENREQHQCRSNQMSGIAEQTLHHLPPFRAAGSCLCRL
jgi:hypothetical protein